ncbi:MAG: xanthine dehydrogenase family protein molybdopterin-binding subunit [Acidobacteria bacterium]|nr:xanthine dehydrogenase family protein molybdopterin-binding subunit [Acidobacteriota bacterium]MBV9071740.1 xanthine dehydrogenase family protein molybdopterin-binding subunit [Acidobacteriota bacterium]MBV9187014.1 xanthine dehydrogenase family protein molybdopterin-binding subunit [Acidobacteriota bacterium]
MSTKVNRRDFLRAAGVGSGALVFGSYLTPALQAQGLIHNLINGFPVDGIPVVILKVNGDVVIITHRPEMGQGIRSSLAAVLADEMEADWKRVTLKQADADAKKYAVAFPAPVESDVPLPFPYNTLSKDPKLQYLISPEGSQFTDSSRSMTAYFTVMRLFGAGLRLAMIRAAAKKWGVDAKACRAEKHRVYGPSGQSSDYRWLLLGAKKETPTYDEISAALKKPEDFRYIGKGKEPMPFYDALDLVRGKSVFGADVELPGMLTAMIERCPVANGALMSYDAAPALAIDGVRAVLPMFPPGKRGGGVGRGFLPHAGVAVIATNTWAAWQGRRALKPTIKWHVSPHDTYNSVAFRKELEDATSKQGNAVRKLKDVDDAFAQVGVDTKEAHYYVPHLAQTPMEPPVAVAVFQNGKMEVWAPTQSPDYAQIWTGQVALGIDPCGMTDDVCNEKARQASTVHVTMLGGGFGRKSKPDYIVEAAMLAKQMPGVPIRVQWTREDDVKFSYYNAASSQYLKASLGADKLPTALLQRSALTSFFGTLIPNYSTPDLSQAEIKGAADLRAATFGGGAYPYASGIERAQGLEDMPYDIPNIRLENCKAENHIRVGWMRSVANVYHAFAINSFAGELAIAAGRDQKDYLLDLIGKDRIIDEKTFIDQSVERFRNNELPLAAIEVPTVKGGKANQVVAGFPPDTSRLRAVIEKVAQESDWTNKVAKYKNMKGRGLGIAAHRSFLSYVAVVVDASMSNDNKLTINDVYATIHCGLAVNRDRVLAQMEGGVVYGLSYALLGEITVKNGAVVQNNFDDYPVLRLNQTPRIHVSIVDSNEPPTGVGEPPTPAVAPALANAIAAAGGPRLRAMPFAAKNDSGSTDEKIVFL